MAYSSSVGAQLFLAPGASTKKAAAAVGKALAGGALRHSGWAWGDVAAYEAEVNALPRFLVDTGLASGALMLNYLVDNRRKCWYSIHLEVAMHDSECMNRCTCCAVSGDGLAQQVGLKGIVDGEAAYQCCLNKGSLHPGMDHLQ